LIAFSRSNPISPRLNPMISRKSARVGRSRCGRMATQISVVATTDPSEVRTSSGQ
jgi:hypothetical protein